MRKLATIAGDPKRCSLGHLLLNSGVQWSVHRSRAPYPLCTNIHLGLQKVSVRDEAVAVADVLRPMSALSVVRESFAVVLDCPDLAVHPLGRPPSRFRLWVVGSI